MTVNRNSRCTFFGRGRHSPISRIAIVLLVLGVIATGCDGLGLGNASPTAQSGPAPGSTIQYDVIGASDANGVGSSGVCLPDRDCPNGMGYAQVAGRQLQVGAGL